MATSHNGLHLCAMSCISAQSRYALTTTKTTTLYHSFLVSGRQSRTVVSLQDIQFQLEQALGCNCATGNLQYVTHYIDCPISGSLFITKAITSRRGKSTLALYWRSKHIAVISLSQSSSIFLIFL